jgi:hypothetical protein
MELGGPGPTNGSGSESHILHIFAGKFYHSPDRQYQSMLIRGSLWSSTLKTIYENSK